MFLFVYLLFYSSLTNLVPEEDKISKIPIKKCWVGVKKK
jgi:hypothetical protein